MKFPLILLGVVILLLSIILLNKIKQLKLLSIISLGISIISILLLITVIKNKGGVNLIEQPIVKDSTRISNTPSKNSNEQITIVKIKEKVLLEAPIIKQFPELPRGCEVTSLAMLLQYKGFKTNKMELAAKIKKNTTPLKNIKGSIYWGSPNDGFIGDMYSYDNPGYGVYHAPIKDLAEQFLPGQIVDLTGSDFKNLKTYLSLDIPIWIITNTSYKRLPESSFQLWQTPVGVVKITYKEHSVLITGYDEKYIYFNDPISGTKNKSVLLDDFIEAWEQMGSQAVTYLPDPTSH